jgi:hypothetical protein
MHICVRVHVYLAPEKKRYMSECIGLGTIQLVNSSKKSIEEIIALHAAHAL